jgi:putative thioredoxin
MSYDTGNFEQDVIQRSHQIPVLVDFWAEWCGPCKILGPVLEKLVDKYKDQWALVKLNTEKYQQLSAEYGIRSIPNVKLFVDGKVKDEFIGALPENMIEQWLKKAIPSNYSDMIKMAREQLEQGTEDRAIKILQEVIDAEPNNYHANILMAKALVFSDPQKSSAILKEVGENQEYSDTFESITTIINLLQHLDGNDLPPDDPSKLNYLKSIRELRAKHFEQALNNFIDVLQQNRSYDGDGSRKACIAIFKYLGEDHQITKKFRPIFSSALYS